jgi:hypothetical protein
LPIHPEMQIGRSFINGSVIVADNYMPLPLIMNNWRAATISGNLFAAGFTNFLVNLNQGLTALNANWNSNTYFSTSSGTDFFRNLNSYTFEAWQELTGFDRQSTFLDGGLSGTKVFVRSNAYEPGRAHIVVYNWDNLDEVSVDLRSVLPAGAWFEIRHAQNPSVDPLLRGVYDGQLLQLPMTSLTPASPNGGMLTPSPTGPTFDVFLLLPRNDKLDIRHQGNSVQLRWPMHYGMDALQVSTSLGPAGWVAHTNTPVLLGDQFLLTEPAATGATFYRLQIR